MRRISKGKTVRPTYFVFCEGETEEVYIKYLRALYRVPIEIDAKIAGNRITQNYIANYKTTKTCHPKDKTFLVYDLDVPDTLVRLQNIKEAEMISSNPCFELWYLLHCQDVKKELTSAECLKKLKNHIKQYRKGEIDSKLRLKLAENGDKAQSRASKQTALQNPSTAVYRLVASLEEQRI
jgi:hypothetical protein